MHTITPPEDTVKLSDYDYSLPKEFIAQQPLENRDDARLLILHRGTGMIEHRRFREMVGYFSSGDFLVLNNTRVIPARVFGTRGNGASVELLLIEEIGENCWKALTKTRSRLKAGEEIYAHNNSASARLLEKTGDGSWIIRFDHGVKVRELLTRIGKMPLPPYIKRSRKEDEWKLLDEERYQTVFAQKEGAIAAPTAGLHFSKKTFEELHRRGVETGFVTLHAGLGTFSPVKSEDVREHVMHKEYYECPAEVIQKMLHTKAQGRRVIATGSTSCRVLETVALNEGTPQLSGWTNLFIYPPYHFRYVNALITNFHLPKTTLLLLVSAFAGRENTLRAYEEAKNCGYRFFSYGDCMLII